VTTYGREVADRVLCVVSDRVRANIRVFDGFARTGDAEFVLVLSGLSEDRARVVCEKIRASIAEPMEPLEGAFLSQTVSVGLATWNATESASALEKRARDLLSAAREVGADQLRT
jgi:diguanylate cyclase (GGDEF)-like protein